MKTANRQTILLWLTLLMLPIFLLTGCKKQEATTEELAQPTVQIARAAYGYDQGYTPVEGWEYEMTLSAQGQISQLNALLDEVQFEMLDEEFLMNTGYRLTFRDAQGQVTKDLLLLANQQASIEGSMYRTQNAQPLIDWLDALRLEEQSVVG